MCSDTARRGSAAHSAPHTTNASTTTGAAVSLCPAEVAAAKLTACEAAYRTARTALQECRELVLADGL
ncbi:hypothetical protein [Streptomyces sp. NPDC004658]|uniref:hypothetical protein n=1 Tax=Streptomyces sp. NPDC004658 TaxID=3154672 RepID=UPI0033A38D55